MRNTLFRKSFSLGFTVVELVVVIVVIGILITTTTVLYRGAQSDAAVSVVKSDLASAAKTLIIVRSKTGCPANADNLPKSNGTTYVRYSCNAQSFCLQATHEVQAAVVNLRVTQEGKVAEGTCP